MRLSIMILLIACNAIGATFYVRTNGNDSTGDGSTGNPWRTISRGVTGASSGDTIMVGSGDFAEHTAVNKSLSFYPEVLQSAKTRAMRLQTTNITIFGLQFQYHSEANFAQGGSWGGPIRIEPAAHNATIISNLFGPSPFVKATNFSFISGSPTNAIYSPLVDFNAAGFTNQSHIYIGSSGLDGLWPSNHNTAWLVHSISGDGKTMYVTNNTASSFISDPGTNYWAFIHHGNGSEASAQINGVLSGGTYATNWNVWGNTFSNHVGMAIYAYVDTAYIRSNYFTMHHGYRTIALQGKNIYFENNLVKGLRSAVRYTQPEVQSLVHPEGADWFDYGSSEFSAFSGNSSNIWFRWNWIQDVDNQIGLADPYTNSYGFYLHSNVWVGLTESFSGGRSGMEFVGNTFYKASYDHGFSNPLGLGSSYRTEGGSVLNLKVLKNLFIDAGDHSGGTNYGNTEGFYTISTNAVNPETNYNWVAGGEVLGYQAKTTFFETNGVNGGNPAFVEPSNPLGPDGLPFTEDDGLRPIPGSRVATLGLGALAPPTNTLPVASFQLVSPAGAWLDPVDTNVNRAWTDLKPWDRAPLGSIQPWQTPALIGAPPLQVTFTATNSYAPSGSYVKSYTWDFGDGTVVTRRAHDVYFTAEPTATHWFTRTGTFNVKLTITNSSGLSDSMTNAYRVEGAFTRTVYHVATNGNDSTGTGSQSAPWRTIQKAVTNITAGTMIAVQAGSYFENVDVTKAASETNRAYIIGHGATSGRFNMRVGDYTIDGFTLSTNAGSLGLVYFYPTAHRIHLINNVLGPATNNTFGVNMVQGVDANPASSSSFNIISNNVCDRIDYIHFNFSGGTNYLRNNWAYGGNGQADFSRPNGQGHWIDANVFEYTGVADQSHIDVVQWFGFRSEVNFGFASGTLPVDGNSLTVNGVTRTWRNTVGTPSSEVLIGGTLGACATNLWNQLQANPISGATPAWESGPNIAVRSPTSGVQLTYSRSGTWGTYSASETPEQWFKDIVISRNYTKDSATQLNQLETYEENTNHVGPVYWMFNVFTAGAAANMGANGMKWFNNTFYYATTNTGHVLGGGGSKGSAYGTEYYNNAFIRCGSDPENSGFGWYNTSPMLDNGSLISDWNFVVGGSGTNWEAKAEPLTTNNWGFQKFRSYNLDANSLNPGTDPLLLNPSGFDYRPSTNSPLYGAGTNIYSRIPSFARKDLAGNDLSPTNAWSIGAYQVSGTAASGGGGGGGSPSTPTGLRIRGFNANVRTLIVNQ